MQSRTIYNRVIGDTVRFIKTGADTAGTYLLAEITVAPKGGNSAHYHTDFSETFEVKEGILSVLLGKRIVRLEPGQRAIVPRNTLHRFFNESETATVTFTVTLNPPGRFEETLRILYGMANAGLVDAGSKPKKFWHLAYLMEQGQTYIPGMPPSIQKAIFRVLGSIARIRGVDKELEPYKALAEMPMQEALAA